MHHGVTFNSGSGKVCSPGIFETCVSLSYDKDIWIATSDYVLSNICSSINKFYSFTIFSLLIRGHDGAVITHLPPTSDIRVLIPARPQVGKLVVACRGVAVYSTVP